MVTVAVQLQDVAQRGFSCVQVQRLWQEHVIWYVTSYKHSCYIVHCISEHCLLQGGKGYAVLCRLL